MSVGIVTDSTCYLPAEVIAELGIEVVPLQVISNGVAFNEVGGITVDEVANALRSGKSVTTSRPNPEVFVAAFEKLHNAGHESIVSVHLSSELSGTYESAVLASRKVDFQVDVVDSRGIAMMLGFAVQLPENRLFNPHQSHVNKALFMKSLRVGKLTNQVL